MRTTAKLFLGKIVCEKEFSKQTGRNTRTDLMTAIVDNQTEFEKLINTLDKRQRGYVEEWLIDRWTYLKGCLSNLSTSSKDLEWINHKSKLITETGQEFDKDTFIEELASAALFEPELYFEDMNCGMLN